MTLMDLYTTRLREHYVRITILNWDETEEKGMLTGVVTGGNISVNGNSAVRRTGSLSCVIDKKTLHPNITDIKNLIAIDKRTKIEIGLKAPEDIEETEYKAGDIVWFPQGIFILSGASVQHNINNITLSANLKDKMCLLNGECGGMFSRAMVHTPIYDYSESTDKPVKKNVLFRTLITTLVKEYSGLRDNQIHIDLGQSGDKINQIVSWTGKNQLYYKDGVFSQASLGDGESVLQYGDAMGFQRVDFTYPIDKELTSNTGESVVSVLDKIKATLGNFEYFFDINGEFWFQPIANFQNKGSAQDNLVDALKETLDYGHPLNSLTDNGKDRYITFDFSNLDWVTAVTNSPKYEAIKNDLSITGVRGDNKQMIQYHLIFEDIQNNKLAIPEGSKFSIYTDDLGVVRLKYDESGISAPSNLDYRTQMYLGYLALEAINNLPSEAEWRLWGKELKEWWPHTMQFTLDNEVLTEQFKVLSNLHALHNINYYFEMVDMSDYNLNVSQIGHRPKSINNDKVNVIFQTEPPHVFCVVASSNTTAQDRKDVLTEIGKLNNTEPKPNPLYTFTQVPQNYGNSIAQGLAQNSAYDNMRSMAHSVIQYNEGLSLTILPLYFLEPNTLIAVQDVDAGIPNETYYEIKSYSVPLTSNGTMSLSCVRATTLI